MGGSNSSLSLGIKTVQELLNDNKSTNEKLTVPEYQRPYKWQIRHVKQLLKDIEKFTKEEKSKYRIGTVVVHKDKEGKLNIVDGQQRLTTLTLILHALECKKLSLLDQEYKLLESRQNISHNYCFIKSYIKAHISDKKNFRTCLLGSCELVYVELDDISAAFQFFDSQNSRGKALEPHDLLKAYHLREMSTQSLYKYSEEEYVNKWEAAISRVSGQGISLGCFMSLYLFRIRRWSLGKSAIEFTKDEINDFKGVSFERNSDYRYVKLLRGLNDLEAFRPTSLVAPIVNGAPFFDYVLYYLHLHEKLFGSIGSEILWADDQEGGKKSIAAIVLEPNAYKGWNRTGDNYIRSLYKCALMFYYDKFGEVEIKLVARVLFRWVYRVRLEQYSIHQKTIDRLGSSLNGAFRIIVSATHPIDVIESDLNQPLPSEINEDRKICEIMEYFEGNQYVC